MAFSLDGDDLISGFVGTSLIPIVSRSTIVCRFSDPMCSLVARGSYLKIDFMAIIFS